MSRRFVRGVVVVSAIALALPPQAFAQPKPVRWRKSATATQLNVAQLDAMLAPIALYPMSCRWNCRDDEAVQSGPFLGTHRNCRVTSRGGRDPAATASNESRDRQEFRR